MTRNEQNPFGEVIHSYTRAQALEDGALVDVSETASEAGFKWPVAITRAAWDAYVEIPLGMEGRQDGMGRLWDIIWMCSHAVRGSNAWNQRELRFSLLVICQDKKKRRVELKAVSGPGDEGEPVFTIMLPNED